MQPSYDSWDLDPIPGLVEQGLANGGCGKGGCQDMSAYGLVDISKGKGKGYNGGTAPTDTWDTWEPAFGNGPAAMPQPTFSGSAEVPRPALPGPGMANSKGPAFDASKGKGGIWRTPSPDSYGKAGSSFAGKGGLSGKAPAGGGVFVPEPGSKGKPGFSFKGTLAPRKADFNAKGDFPNPKPASLIQPVNAAFADARATPPSSVPVPPPSFMQGKGGFGQPGVGPVRGQMPGFTSMAPQLDGTPRGPVRPPVVAPRVPAYRGDLPSGGKGVGVPPRLPLMGARGTTIRPPGNAGLGTTIRPPGSAGLGLAPQTSVTGLGTALAAAVVSRSGAGTVLRPPPPQSRFVPPARPALLGAPAQPGGTPPPPVGLAPLHSFGGQGLAANLPKLPPPLPNTPHTVLPQTSPSGLAPELAALVSAEGDNDSTGTRLGPPIPEKKPRIYLLVTRLSPELDEGHLQQIIEQCGEVQAFRRGRDSDGKPLSFGFAQFGDPEAAWKASTCLSKRVLGGQEIKVLVEEHAETLIQQWRRSQQAALRVSTDEELDWELERKAVSCKASIDAKVEELYGPPEDGSGGGAIAQRRQELRERERQRVDRLKKRKAWREEEFNRELSRVESAQKRLRAEEVLKDRIDRDKEASELKEKEVREEEDLKLSSLEDAPPGSRTKASAHSENRKLVDMVDVVQAEPRDDLFRIELNLSFLRHEKILEKKLRPWLERKVDLCMGGPQSDLVEYILRRVNAQSMPDALISELTRYLDDNAEPLVERMWRMLAFELMRGGFAFTGSLKKPGQPPAQGQTA